MTPKKYQLYLKILSFVKFYRCKNHGATAKFKNKK